MPAYIVAHVVIRDLEGWQSCEYMPVLARLFEKYGVRQIGASLHDQLEGPALEGTFTAIDEFPDIDSARAFWNDPEYQRVIPIRQRFVDAQVVLVGAPSG